MCVFSICFQRNVALSSARSITQTDGINERCFDHRTQTLDKHRELSGIIGSIDGRVILLLVVVDDGFLRQPDKGRIPFSKKKYRLNSSNDSIIIISGILPKNNIFHIKSICSYFQNKGKHQAMIRREKLGSAGQL